MISEISERDGTGLKPVWTGSILLATALLVVACCAAVYVGSRSGPEAVLASFAAATICWVSGTVALLITALCAARPNSVAGILLSIFVRSGIPLAIAIVSTSASARLANSGLFGLILLHYLVGLAVETTLAVQLIGRATQRRNRLC